jgi:hypothetical protein
VVEFGGESMWSANSGDLRPCTGQTTAVVASLAGSSRLTNEMKALFNCTDAFNGELNFNSRIGFGIDVLPK